jgi:hypothetical protein
MILLVILYHKLKFNSVYCIHKKKIYLNFTFDLKYLKS